MRQHLHLDPERKEMLALKECNVPKYFFLNFVWQIIHALDTYPGVKLNVSQYSWYYSIVEFFLLYISNDFMASKFFNYTVKICSYLLIADKCR